MIRPSTRLVLALEGTLLGVLAVTWVVAYVAAARSLTSLPPGTRNYLLAVYRSNDQLWIGLVLGLVGAGALILRHWYPGISFAVVSAVVFVVERFVPYLTRVQFATTIMLLVAVFWLMWRTRHFAIMAGVSMVVAAAVAAPGYRVDQNVAQITFDGGTATLAGLTWTVTTLQLLLLVAVAIAAAALVRRLDAQAVELLERNLELTEQRAASARVAVLDERVRIARELHDVVAHHVTTMTVHAGAARQVVELNPAAVSESLHQIEKGGRTAVVELQRLLGFLRGDTTHPHEREAGRAPVPSLRHLDGLEGELGGGLRCEVSVEGDLSRVPQSVDVSAYRIVQEALTNVLKHSTAIRAEVDVFAGRDEVVVRIVDRGRAAGRERLDWARYSGSVRRVGVADDTRGSGTPAALQDDAGGLGLVGMRERALLHGGSLSAGPRAEGGWLVEARLPYERSGG